MFCCCWSTSIQPKKKCFVFVVDKMLFTFQCIFPHLKPDSKRTKQIHISIDYRRKQRLSTKNCAFWWTTSTWNLCYPHNIPSVIFNFLFPSFFSSFCFNFNLLKRKNVAYIMCHCFMYHNHSYALVTQKAQIDFNFSIIEMIFLQHYFSIFIFLNNNKSK